MPPSVVLRKATRFSCSTTGAPSSSLQCNLCVDRLEAGEEPACSFACPVGALYAGKLIDLAEIARGKVATRLAGATLFVTP